MKNLRYPHLFSPIEIGNFVVPNRIVHAPTDISSANADGSVNQRVITYHEEVAKGRCFIIVGATTPDKATGRPTVTCVAADEDPMIPGLANLAEAMHRHGARCAVQIQHPGRQAAWPRKDLLLLLIWWFLFLVQLVMKSYMPKRQVLRKVDPGYDH